jgi:hypothetical protein
MNNNSLNSAQLEALLRYAASQLGMTPEKLASTVKSGGLAEVSKQLPAQKAAKLNALIGDKQQAEQWLRSPQTSKLLDDFLKKQGR